MRVVWFGEDEYSRTMLQMQASSIRLEDGLQALSAEGLRGMESAVLRAEEDITATAEFQQAQGRHAKGEKCRGEGGEIIKGSGWFL